MPSKAEDIVTFLLPDGTEVSNDPRWHQQKAMEKFYESQEYTGVVTSDDASMKHSMVHPPQSGQPGVGAAAVGPGDRSQAGANTQPAEGESPVRPSQARAAAHTSRQGQVGTGEDEDDGDDGDAPVELDEADMPYEEWSPADLKAEVKARRKMGREVPVEGRATKTNVIAALKADDEAAENES